VLLLQIASCLTPRNVWAQFDVREVASFWKRPPLDLHSDVVIEQLTKDTAQVSTVTITEMEIKICNLYARPTMAKTVHQYLTSSKACYPHAV
jgi:hypothetical protein